VAQRIAACWALIGFAVQCVSAVFGGHSFADGLQRALAHYLGWGIAGFIVGTVLERVLETAVRNLQHRATTQQTSETPPTKS
jgi:hypothetical protein